MSFPEGVDMSAAGLSLGAEPSAKLWVGRHHLGIGLVMSPIWETFAVILGANPAFFIEMQPTHSLELGS